MIQAEITSFVEPEPGCRFASRCLYCKDCCHSPVGLTEVEPGYFVSCARVKETNNLLGIEAGERPFRNHSPAFFYGSEGK